MFTHLAFPAFWSHGLSQARPVIYDGHEIKGLASATAARTDECYSRRLVENFIDTRIGDVYLEHIMLKDRFVDVSSVGPWIDYKPPARTT
jgi:hypothetical protein